MPERKYARNKCESVAWRIFASKIITCLSYGLDGEKDKRKPQARQVRRADTNIIVVDFGVLKKSGEIHTGDCVVCTNVNCGTALSHLSLLKEGLHQNETVCIYIYSCMCLRLQHPQGCACYWQWLI